MILVLSMVIYALSLGRQTAENATLFGNKCRSARPNTSPLFRFCVSLARCNGVTRCVGLTIGTHSGRLSSDD